MITKVSKMVFFKQKKVLKMVYNPENDRDKIVQVVFDIVFSLFQQSEQKSRRRMLVIKLIL